MRAVQGMTGSGGWPMTVFLLPDGTPFFAGTYFPPSDRFGMPAFQRVLTAVAEAAARLARDFDAAHAGFGGAPKFPQPMLVEVLLRHHVRTGQPAALEMALQTLRAMAAGGIYDQLGGGFHRYSVDERWLVPHFEKMLYDNALLTGAYLDAWQLTHDPALRRVAEETLAFVLREMTS